MHACIPITGSTFMISGKNRPERRLLPVLLGLLISTPALADLSLEMLLQQFSRIASDDVRFREVRQLALLEEPLVLEGILSYQAPDHLRKEVLTPEPSQFDISGNSLHIETANEQRTLPLDSHPLLRAFAESYRAILAGNETTLEEYFETELTGSIDSWTLRLQPRDRQARAYLEKIIMKGSGNRIHSAETLEASGDKSLMTLLPDND